MEFIREDCIYARQSVDRNAFNIEKFLSTRMPMRPGERYRNYEVTAEDLASQTL